MRRPRRSSFARRLAAGVTVGVAVLVSGVAALAFWSSTGDALGSVRVGTLEPATISAVASGAGDVEIAWETPAQTEPDSVSSDVTYTVERRLDGESFGSVAVGECAGRLSYGTAACTDSLDVPGTYSYRVVAHLGSSWAAVSNVATVTVAFDSTPPATTIAFPTDGATLNTPEYGGGCVPTGVCGAATDTSGVTAVRVAVRRVSDGAYWTGTGFGGFSPYSLDAALLTPGATSTSWSLPLPLPPDGQYVVDVTAKDGAGNDSAPTPSSTSTFVVDTVGPVTALTTAPPASNGANGWFRRSSVEVSLTASDPAPGSGVAATSYEVDGEGNQVFTGPVTIATQGEHTVTFRSVDAAGNVGPAGTAHIALDDVAPVTSLTLTPPAPDGADGWYRTAPTFTLAAADATSGVATTWYRIDGGQATEYGGDPVSLPDGHHAVSYWSTDVAGNTEAVRTTAEISIDTLAPSAALATQPATPDGTDGWFRQPGVTFTLDASDATSGIASRLFAVDGGATRTYTQPVTLSGPGDHVVRYWALDAAGNAGLPLVAHLKLDAVAPSTTATTTPAAPDGSNGWFTRAGVTVALAATDATSGVASTSFAVDGGPAQGYSGPVSVAGPGSHSVAYWSTDAAGNVEATKTLTVELDDTGPTSTLVTSPSAPGGDNDWFTSNVTFTLGAVDDASGVAGSRYRIDGGVTRTYTGPVTVAQGDHTIEHWAVDNAGNAGAHVTTRVKVDGVAPATTLATTPGEPDGSNGWFRRQSVEFTLASTDAASGVAERLYTIDGGEPQPYTGPVTVTGQGDHTITYQATDNAGNAEPVRSTHIKLDDVAPTVAVSLVDAGAAVLSGTEIVYRRTAPAAGRTFRVRATVGDTTSRPASATYPAITTPGWSHVAETGVTTPGSGVYDSSPLKWLASAANPAGYSFSVADEAGNTTVETLTFTSDVTPPTAALALAPEPVGALLAGTSLYVRTDQAGSFTLVDSVSDSGSGPASATFPAILSSGWSHPAEIVTSGTGAAPTIDYPSARYSWTAGASAPPTTYVVTSTDRVGNAASVTVSLLVDDDGPTGGALRVNGVDATGTGTTSTSVTGGFAIDARTDYSADDGSGLATSVLTREQAPLDGDGCGTFGASTTIEGAPAQTGLADGCYRYTLTGTDKLGNVSRISTTVTVKSLPVVALTSVTDGGGHREVFTGTTTELSGTITIRVTWRGLEAQTFTFAATSSPWTFESEIWDLIVGFRYTARVRQTDGDGNTSDWSDPFEFVAF